MMPHQQENAVTPDNPAIPNRPENSSVHAEPPSSAANHIRNTNNSHQHPQPNISPPRFSVLRQSLPPVTLKFEDVTYSITFERDKNGCVSSPKQKHKRTVLNGVTGMVGPGEVMAMLGPSGSGKTTLLTALAGRLTGKLSGAVTYNNHPFSSSMRRNIGFVSQEDVLYPHLTVIETLTYAAMLKLPRSLTREEKMDQAEMIIQELGLSRCRNNLVGGGAAVFRGISGGERKRVNIGQEMLVNPSLLLLDEPTSGLDSTTAQRIVAMLHSLARSGRTVVTTIHQPSSRLFWMFDKVLLLSDGYPLFTGQACRAMNYFESIGFVPTFNFINPADFLLDLANGIVVDVKEDEHLDHHEDQASIKQFLVSSYKKNAYPLLKQEIQQNQRELVCFASRTLSPENQWTTGWWEQSMVLLKRGLKERRHESYSRLRIFQVLSVSILSGLLWWNSNPSDIQDQVGLLFFYSIFWGFFPLFNAIFAFPLDRPMLIKERSSGMYHLSSYYVARTVGDLPMELVLPTIFVTISYWMGGLKPSLVTFVFTLLIMLFNVIVSQGIGLALGAILMDAKQATTLASVTMLVFLLAGGYYIQQIPFFISWLKYISFSHYCYKLLAGVQYSVNEVYECEPGLHCKIRDFPAIKCLGLGNLSKDVLVLTIMLIEYRVVAYLALKKVLHR
ncbi:ABC transporter G family member 21-like [Vigna umbellata]|uniref:ABC transporter G family member 21-like n=1 Tax=Vigna umbellata TaxID=87088 RepID=UPI001F5E42EF|nr:ABC transporter G family member 21-like [Vigna umbellata]XP_047171514.1 ABC transporter G family member 21-like [Vigna umbellata]